MKSIAFCINKTDVSQTNILMLTTINRLVIERGIDCAIFHSDFAPLPVPCLAGMYQLCEMWDFEGTVITPDFAIAQQLINCPGPRAKYFYIWDFFWAKLPQPLYNDIAKVYCSDSLELIARSQEHDKVLTQCFKKPAHIIEDWNLEQIEQIIV